MSEELAGQKSLFENFGLLTKRDDEGGFSHRGKGESREECGKWGIFRSMWFMTDTLLIVIYYTTFRITGSTHGIENVDERVRVLEGVESSLTDDHMERKLTNLRSDMEEVSRESYGFRPLYDAKKASALVYFVLRVRR